MIHKEKIKKAFKWQLLTISVHAVLQISFIMLGARLIPKEVHGAFAILYALVFMMSIFSDAGVSAALIQRKEINLKHISIAFYSSLIISLILFLLVFLFSSDISLFYEEKIKIQEIRVASFIFVMIAVAKVSESLLIREFRYKELFISKSFSFFIGNIIVMCILAVNNLGIYALIIGFITMQFINSLTFFLWTRHTLLIRFGKKEFQELYYFGYSFTILRIVNYLCSQIDKLLIGRYLPLDVLSLYEKGQYVSKMPPKYLGNIVDSLMFSVFSKIDDDVIKKDYFVKICALILVISSYFSILLFFNSSLVVTIFLGQDWIKSIPFLQILSLSIPAVILSRIGDIVVRSENKMLKSIPIKLFFFSLLILVILYFKNHNYLMLTSIIVVSYWIHSILMLYLSLSIVNARYFRMIKLLLIILMAVAFISLKYYSFSFLIPNPWLFLIFNLFVDIVIIYGLAFIFRNNSDVHGATQIFKNLIINLLHKWKT